MIFYHQLNFTFMYFVIFLWKLFEVCLSRPLKMILYTVVTTLTIFNNYFCHITKSRDHQDIMKSIWKCYTDHQNINFCQFSLQNKRGDNRNVLLKKLDKIISHFKNINLVWFHILHQCKPLNITSTNLNIKDDDHSKYYIIQAGTRAS